MFVEPKCEARFSFVGELMRPNPAAIYTIKIARHDAAAIRFRIAILEFEWA